MKRSKTNTKGACALAPAKLRTYRTVLFLFTRKSCCGALLLDVDTIPVILYVTKIRQ